MVNDFTVVSFIKKTAKSDWPIRGNYEDWKNHSTITIEPHYSECTLIKWNSLFTELEGNLD